MSNPFCTYSSHSSIFTIFLLLFQMRPDITLKSANESTTKPGYLQTAASAIRSLLTVDSRRLFSEIIDVKKRRSANIDSDHMLKTFRSRSTQRRRCHHTVLRRVEGWTSGCFKSGTTCTMETGGSNSPESNGKHHQIQPKKTEKGVVRRGVQCGERWEKRA
jgi:hypothetical protein